MKTPDTSRLKFHEKKTGNVEKVCQCGKQFNVYPYRAMTALYCSPSCRAKFMPHRSGYKSLAGSLAKLGDKNPMKRLGMSDEHRKRFMEGTARYIETVRVSKEQKKLVKKLCNIAYLTRKRGVFGTLDKYDWQRVIEDQEGHCAICLRTEPNITLTVDHIIPISRWNEWIKENPVDYGCNDYGNIQALCKSCNSTKKDRI